MQQIQQIRQIQNRPWQQGNIPQSAPQYIPQSGNVLGNGAAYNGVQDMQSMQSLQTPNMAGTQNRMGMQNEMAMGMQGMQPMQPMMGQASQMQIDPSAQTKMMQTQQPTEQTKQFVQQEILRLHEVFPMCNINSLADLAATAEGRLTLEYWRRGVPLEEAYRVAFGAQLQENQAKAARQQALNDVNSKRHLTQPRGQAAGGARMSAEDKAIWREFFPNATDAQLLEKWRKMG